MRDLHEKRIGNCSGGVSMAEEAPKETPARLPPGGCFSRDLQQMGSGI